MKNKLELLAPAGNQENFHVALGCGADAIYLGANAFNARGNIENISIDDLTRLTEKAHLFGVKVYLTLNTLIHDSEVEEVLMLVRQAIKAKVDAFIVQDIGLCFLLKNKFENIELHASTQMGISNLEGAKFLSPLGFKRVVLARETSLSEIRRIKSNTNYEIEYFIQGALCVGFSGNCYLSSLLSQASGNRGKCKQFCRLPFSANFGNGEKQGFLLSTKDFCMLPKLSQLADAGVTSFKVEGRARRAAYVGQAISVYRRAIDNNFNFGEDDLGELKIAFNRGDYIAGYFDDEKILYDKTQNHIGLKIGKVIAVNNGKRFNEVTINSSHNLSKGDSLKFFVGEKEVASLSVQDLKQKGKNVFSFTTTTLVPKEANVSLIGSSELEDAVLKKKRKIDVEAKLVCKIASKPQLTLKAGEIEVTVEGDEKLEEAKSSPLNADECKVSLSKLGEEFSLAALAAELEPVFLRKAQLNNLRRIGIEKLRERIIVNYEKINKLNEIYEKEWKICKKANKNIKKIVISSNFQKLLQCSENDYIVYSPQVFDKTQLSLFAQMAKDRVVYLDLPVIATEADIKLFKEILAENKNFGVMASNYYALTLTSKEKMIVGSEMNVFNSYAIAFYLSLGYDKIILSKETLDLDDISSQGGEIFVPTSVRHRLIYFKHCPFKEHAFSTCANCKYKAGVMYNLAGQGKFELCRVKASSCQFYLKQINTIKKESKNFGEFIEI